MQSELLKYWIKTKVCVAESHAHCQFIYLSINSGRLVHPLSGPLFTLSAGQLFSQHFSCLLHSLLCKNFKLQPQQCGQTKSESHPASSNEHKPHSSNITYTQRWSALKAQQAERQKIGQNERNRIESNWISCSGILDARHVLAAGGLQINDLLIPTHAHAETTLIVSVSEFLKVCACFFLFFLSFSVSYCSTSRNDSKGSRSNSSGSNSNATHALHINCIQSSHVVRTKKIKQHAAWKNPKESRSC